MASSSRSATVAPCVHLTCVSKRALRGEEEKGKKILSRFALGERTQTLRVVRDHLERGHRLDRGRVGQHLRVSRLARVDQRGGHALFRARSSTYTHTNFEEKKHSGTTQKEASYSLARGGKKRASFTPNERGVNENE